VTGWILDKSNSWALVFGVAAVMYLIGGIIYLSLAGADDITAILNERQNLLSGHSSDTYTGESVSGDGHIKGSSDTSHLIPSSSSSSSHPINGRRRGSSRSSTGGNGAYGSVGVDVEVMGTPPSITRDHQRSSVSSSSALIPSSSSTNE
jgi:hypothetical protein